MDSRIACLMGYAAGMAITILIDRYEIPSFGAIIFVWVPVYLFVCWMESRKQRRDLGHLRKEFSGSPKKD